VAVSWMAECTGLCQMSVNHIEVMTKVWDKPSGSALPYHYIWMTN